MSGAEDWAYEVFANDPLRYGSRAVQRIARMLGLAEEFIDRLTGDADVRTHFTNWLAMDTHA
eukprot:41249-Eustigmatos_ZCMA.PRE.1